MVPPMLLEVVPSAALTLGQSTLTLFGAGFGSTPRVFLDDLSCPISISTPLHIECMIPCGVFGNVSVSVWDEADIFSPAVQVAITQVGSCPLLTAVAPASPTTNTPITLAGQNFDQGTTVAVSIGGAPCVISQISSTSILCMLPALVPRVWSIVVLVDGKRSNIMEIPVSGPLPSLTSVSPSAVFAGQPLTLSGSGFLLYSGIEVRINGLNCSLISSTATRLVCRVPWMMARNYSVWTTLASDSVSSVEKSIAVLANGQSDFSIAASSSTTCLGVGSLGILHCVPSHSSNDGDTWNLGPFFSIGLGESHACVVLVAQGTARCWGLNYFGQLGLNHTYDISGPDFQPPPDVSLPADAVLVSLGQSFTCALLVNGRVYCWGYNYGALGIGIPDAQIAPTTAANLTGYQITDLSAGPAHVCLLSAAGQVACWGANESGQLGIGINSVNPTVGDQPGEMPPQAVTLLAAAVQVKCGQEHTCALLSSDQLQCWGRNRYGQLGAGWDSATVTAIPGPALNIPPIASLALLQSSTCVLYRTGGVTCWGYNNNGQLGFGDTNTRYSPISQTIDLGSPSVFSVASGASALHVCALLTDGELKCWGNHASGQFWRPWSLSSPELLRIGDAAGEMPPGSSFLPPVLRSVSPYPVLTPVTVVTLAGSGFGSDIGTLSVMINDTECALTFVSPVLLECLPVYTPGLFHIFVSRVDFGASMTLPLLFLPDQLWLHAVQPASGSTGAVVTLSLWGLPSNTTANLANTAAVFQPLAGPGCPSPAVCTGVVLSVDIVSAMITVEIPALPFNTAFTILLSIDSVIATTIPGVTFTHCFDYCDDCHITSQSLNTTLRCTQCNESSGYHVDLTGASCESSVCPDGQILLENPAQCACNQPTWFMNSDGTACVTSCNSGEYLDRSASIHICRQCDPSCDQCSGAGVDQCNQCRPGQAFTPVAATSVLGSCSPTCEPSFEMQSGICMCPPGTFYSAPSVASDPGECLACRIFDPDSYNLFFLGSAVDLVSAVHKVPKPCNRRAKRDNI
eukprot:TRINITY_DN4428_c1_g1_i2.p1 TRINITY_DN4428_c1_g1~~TRINITY_DN4428_c1_g1_i2.p1  ORF type:complete len:1188 (-),score=177.39 TRINITY_DN4428_c1_g1_i2:1739-4816(-)